MPLYFLLGTMTPEGNRRLHQNQSWVVEAADDLNVEGAKILGQYGVLGRYDFVTLVEADDNNAVARLSLEFGIRAGLRFETLSAITVSTLGAVTPPGTGGDTTAATVSNGGATA